MIPLRLASRFLRADNAVSRTARTTIAPRLCSEANTCFSPCRCFAHVNDRDLAGRQVWFNSSIPRGGGPLEPGGDHRPLDERTLQLGKTVRELHERLPNLLTDPLPSDILSPQITLHLFPSTHPHLPTVSGRYAYVAALWTAPVAWGRVPLVGNVTLTILSERMVRHRSAGGDEKLVVKWKTCGKTTHRDATGGIYRGGSSSSSSSSGGKDPVDKIKDFLNGVRRSAAATTTTTEGETSSRDDSEDFCGIFVFEFDEKGRIVKHTIEHTEEGGRWDRMTRVVSVTDWLLGHFNGRKKDAPALALFGQRPGSMDIRFDPGRSRS